VPAKVAWLQAPASASFPRQSGERCGCWAGGFGRNRSAALLWLRDQVGLPAQSFGVRNRCPLSVAEFVAWAGIRPGFGSTGLEARPGERPWRRALGQKPTAATWPIA